MTASGSRTVRQAMIPGWDQAAFESMSVAVVGGDWAGRFATLSCAFMGFGTVSSIGAPAPGTGRLRSDLDGPDGPIVDYPADPTSPAELAWAVGPADVVLALSPDPRTRRACAVIALQLGVPCFGGSTDGQGWFDSSGRMRTSRAPASPQDPGRALGLAALTTDAARDVACPLTGLPTSGPLSLGGKSVPPPPDGRSGGATAGSEGPVVLLGVGGIGTWVAVGAVAAGLTRLVLVENDTVDESNLNRQLLFTRDDAREGRKKVDAAAEGLRRLGPSVEADALDLFIDGGLAGHLADLHPRLLVSALDNAAARLAVQQAGRTMGIPVVHAGTDVFAADVLCQVPAGPTLDEQMHGAMSRALEVERHPGRGTGCAGAYVVPGLMAGALVVRRVTRLLGVRGPRRVPPLRWRAGALPTEYRST